jgi:hypothetical protein
MPGDSGVTVVTNARAFYTTRAAAGASAPGIPCALCYEGRTLEKQNSREKARRDRETVSAVIARSDLSAVAQRTKAEATKQSSFRFAVLWIASLRSQ